MLLLIDYTLCKDGFSRRSIPDKTVETFQCNFQCRAMQPLCPEGRNSPPSPTPGAMLFRLNSSSMHFLCYRKQHCNEEGGKQSFNLRQFFCQGEWQKHVFL